MQHSPFPHMHNMYSLTAYAWTLIAGHKGKHLNVLECILPINECFSHGQFYIAASRVGHPDHIRFALKRHANGCFYTRNVQGLCSNVRTGMS